MNNTVTKKELFAIAFLISLGGAIVAGGDKESGSDSYLSVIIAAAGIIPLLWIYCSLLKLNPGKTIFELAEQGMGKIFGKTAILLLIFFYIATAGLTLAKYVNFVMTFLLPRTPKISTAAAVMLTAIYSVNSGGDTLAKISRSFFYIICFLLIFSAGLTLLGVNLSKFPLPLFSHGIKPVLLGSLSVTSTPYGDMLLILPLAAKLKKGASPVKPIFKGAAAGWLFLIYIFLRNAIALGEHVDELLYYKSFSAIRLLSLQHFFQHFEIIIIVIYFLADFYKIALCINFATEGLKKIVGLQTKKYTVLPLAMLVMSYTVFMYDNQQQVAELMVIRKFYNLFFQIVIPVLILIFARIKLKKRSLTPNLSKNAVEKAMAE